MQFVREVSSGKYYVKIAPEKIPGFLDIFVELIEVDSAGLICGKDELNFLINLTSVMEIPIGKDLVLKMTQREIDVLNYLLKAHAQRERAV
ncbi:hypothetical protein D3C78_20880 [compost metagenome]